MLQLTYVSKYVQSLIHEALLSIPQVHLLPKEAFACSECKVAFSMKQPPLSLECGHLCCFKCSQSMLRGRIFRREHGPCLRCPDCSYMSLYVSTCGWCILLEANEVAWCNRIRIPTNETGNYIQRVQASIEAKLVMQVQENTLASLSLDVRTTGSLGLWWNLIATDLVIANNAGVRPRHLKHMDHLSLSQISSCAQRNLHQLPDPILQKHLATDENAVDVVWHELVRRSRAKMLRFM